MLYVVGRVILMTSPLLWKLRYRWSFRLHQWLGWKVIRWVHIYKIPLLEEE